MNDNSESPIPTLTDIIQLGDASMKNHFDASLFDQDPEQPSDPAETLISDKLKQTLDTLIQEAMDETLPSIEAQLKEKLTSQILQKLSKD
ncbi:MAG: hypothetical protein OEY61_02345 [Gammaproteobacteria bacterium]|nr:hypothetical protein [Gammaproteobacteria bacterium]